MTESLKRAPFIVIEGLDRSGKTTQTERLHKRLQDAKIDAKVLKFPGQFSASCCFQSLIDLCERQNNSDRKDDRLVLAFYVRTR